MTYVVLEYRSGKAFRRTAARRDDAETMDAFVLGRRVSRALRAENVGGPAMMTAVLRPYVKS